MIRVGNSRNNLIDVPCPSGFQWGLQDISDSDAGRVQDENDTMYKNRTSQKRKISLTWNGLRPPAVALILQAVNTEYFFVEYPDALSGETEVREFYCGDRSAPMKIWNVQNKMYSQLSFNIVER